MAQSGYTPLLVYGSSTAAAEPTAPNLTSSANGAELALNYADGKLFYKNSGGNVRLLAIGYGASTVTPTAGGIQYGTGTAVAFTAAGTAGYILQSNGASAPSWVAAPSTSPGGSTTQVQYNNSGAFAGSANFVFDGTNVGIGTSSPSSFYAGARKLVVGGASGEQGLTIYSGDNFGYLLFATGTSGTNPYSGQVRYDQPTLSMAVINFQNGPLQFLTNNTERMRIDSSGNVGIGTSSPAVKLSFGTQFAGNNGYANAIRLYDDGSASTSQTSNSYGFGFIDTGSLSYTSGTGGNHRFFTGNTERVRIATSGGFSVGTSADPGAGAIYATGAITAFYSDRRLKDVKGTITDALDKVSSLSGVYYTNNEVAVAHGYTSAETQVGLLAQDVEAVLPEVVKAAPFDLDEKGNSKSGEHYKTIQYERVIPLLVEAIKELRAEIQALRG